MVNRVSLLEFRTLSHRDKYIKYRGLRRVMKNFAFACLLLVALLVAGCVETSENVSPPLEQLLETECSSDQDCRPAGCSGQLCEPAGSSIKTTCEDRPEYACLELTSCGCISGSCKWKPSEDYDSCIENTKIVNQQDQISNELR